MFLENSRYFKVDTVQATAAGGAPVTALKLRPLAAPAGDAYTVKDNDQLDVLAQQQYADGTKFWHIADANTALQASDLVAETGATILKPRS
jgi:hypothetical protein